MINIMNMVDQLDDTIFSILGDNVDVAPRGDISNWVRIKAPFEWEVDDGLIHERSHDSQPMLEDVKASDAYLFDNYEDAKVRVNGQTFSVLEFYPKKDRNYTAILRYEELA